ncbi:MAG TPA: ribose 5-phosphate isomerase A, partial [Candidatus Dormibacteraeota bacterium]|nr:ribose 5-phosphate isomerase A [Candidatus Dormibacteraeota bacterium]
ASYFVSSLGQRVSEGLNITAVATSKATADLATSLGIRLVTSADRALDLTVDGADEIDPHLNLIKGLGGALLREKVVAAASLRMIVIAGADKLVPRLGMRAPLPVEVLSLLWERTGAELEELDLRPELRKVQSSGAAFVSDNGNLILDCAFAPPRDLDELALGLDRLPGVLGHGLFLGIATQAIIGDEDGSARVITPAGD